MYPALPIQKVLIQNTRRTLQVKHTHNLLLLMRMCVCHSEEVDGLF